LVFSAYLPARMVGSFYRAIHEPQFPYLFDPRIAGWLLLRTLPIMGKNLSRLRRKAAFAVPLFCYAVVIYFSFSGYKPTLATAEA